MRVATWCPIIAMIAMIAMTLLVRPVGAQQGHPLAGSWHGEWGPPESEQQMDLTVIMDWDGETITGIVNPVTDRAEIENARLDSSEWTVQFATEVRDSTGQTRRCMADGRLDRLGSDRRTLSGTWTCGELGAEFQLTRDRDY